MSHQSDLIATDIHAYLKQHENKELLRFLTCGSVDDGKSTLIGRLLYDSKMIYEDQLAAIERDSKIHGTTGGGFDPALLTDGLKAEREQGITIDVAYRYFSTAKRKFIIADTPGHEQYTRNMATGASTADLAIILIDARHGVLTQTKRHSFIASLLGIKHVLVAINKMDLVDYRAGGVREDPRRLPGLRRPARPARRALHSHLGAQRRQRRRPERAHALVPGQHADELPGDRSTSAPTATWRTFAFRCSSSIGRTSIFAASAARSRRASFARATKSWPCRRGRRAA